MAQTYFGVDVESISDPLKRRAVETMIRTYGQTPKQLFKTPHRSRDNTSTAEAEVTSPMTDKFMQDKHVHGQSMAYTYKVRKYTIFRTQ